MLSKKLSQNIITLYIGGLEVAINRQLFLYEKGTENLYSIVLIEGYSEAYNYIYGRIKKGYLVGRPLQGNIGDNAVYLLSSHLEAFDVNCISSQTTQ